MARWDADTAMGGGGAFPQTRLSAVEKLRGTESDRLQARETLVALYWKPVYKHLRIKWRKSNEDAKDLTQAFFVRSMEKNFFDKYDPSRARFRTFLRTCLDGFVANEETASNAQKRGGDAVFLPLDFHQAEAELALSRSSPEECFDKEWIRSLFSAALADLKSLCEASGRQRQYRLFEIYDIDRDPDRKLTYSTLAEEFGIAATDVTNYLAWARREFRKLVLERLREVTGSETEFRSEARRLFGVKLP